MSRPDKGDSAHKKGWRQRARVRGRKLPKDFPRAKPYKPVKKTGKRRT